ncbi:hypothetical protein PIB30_084342 [Stylosanthes scabra]|uniref:Uncharacterized protein n=1 Tax=Stylosanthes scabra TaxID=79078 RepID=A0ABU6STK3_9FABA|nr:hypothetical protein [Stylosanthes scabra]
MEIPSKDYAKSNLQNRMARNRITVQQLLAMKWESDDQIRLQKILTICTTQFKYHTPTENVTEQEKDFTILATINEIDTKFGWSYVECETCKKKAPKRGDNYICTICKQTPEYPTIRVNDYNLKEGSQNYTVTKTFVPTKATKEQPIVHKIKQEPNSAEITSSEEDDMPINRFKRKNGNQNQVTPSEEELNINKEKKESAQKRDTSTVTYKLSLNTTYQRKKKEASLTGRKKKKK